MVIKRLLMLLFITCTCSITWGQLTVMENGNVCIGKTTLVKETNSNKIVSGSFQIDPSATLSLLTSKANGTGAYLTFGNLKKVGIGEYFNASSTADSDILNLFGEKGLYYSTGSRIIFKYDWSSTTVNPFSFFCPISATSILTSSDARLKTDVSALQNSWLSLMEITPVSYRLQNIPQSGITTCASEKVHQSSISNPENRLQYGFIAQEIKEIFPDLVVEDANGYLSIDYQGFIPILVDAYKRLETRLQNYEEAMVILSESNAKQRTATGIKETESDFAFISQNKPNPFYESSTISCYIPYSSANAFVCIYDLQGKQIKHIDIKDKGSQTITIDGSEFLPGMFIYTLIIDGQEIDTKKMILTD